MRERFARGVNGQILRVHDENKGNKGREGKKVLHDCIIVLTLIQERHGYGMGQLSRIQALEISYLVVPGV